MLKMPIDRLSESWKNCALKSFWASTELSTGSVWRLSLLCYDGSDLPFCCHFENSANDMDVESLECERLCKAEERILTRGVALKTAAALI